MSRTRIVDLRSAAGMTLLELLVVLLIIAILLGVAVPSVLGQRNRASDTVAAASLRQAAPAIAAYHGDNDTYVGMTPAGLRAAYESTLHPALQLFDLTAAAYCAEVSVSGRTWRQAGPGAPVEHASC